MTDGELFHVIETAFRGVKLDGGISLRQGEICDNFGKDNEGKEVSEREFAAIPRTEITDDWSAIPLEELERYPYLAHLDPKGFRYYIPALLLSLLQNSDAGSMRVISTFSALRAGGQFWQHDMERYQTLSPTQRVAVATFLSHLQNDARIDPENQRLVARAVKAYWHQYLPSPGESGRP